MQSGGTPQRGHDECAVYCVRPTGLGTLSPTPEVGGTSVHDAITKSQVHRIELVGLPSTVELRSAWHLLPHRADFPANRGSNVPNNVCLNLSFAPRYSGFRGKRVLPKLTATVIR